jgi:hypothetical protein
MKSLTDLVFEDKSHNTVESERSINRGYSLTKREFDHAALQVKAGLG